MSCRPLQAEPHLPPADRPAGRRGWRGALACAAAFGALVPVLFTQGAEQANVELALTAGAIALLASAALVWTARTRRVLVAAVLLGALGVTAAAAAIRADLGTVSGSGEWSSGQMSGSFDYSYADRGARLSRAAARSVPEGVSEDALRTRLGEPAGDGTTTESRLGTMDCLVYRGRGPFERSADRHAFCFRDGRYAVHRIW